ncbi:MAG: mechanosensitive ion channel family protein [Acidimicrobiales bacterium]
MDPQLLEACGSRPGWPCDALFRATGNTTLAKLGGFLVGTPLKVMLIVLGALILNGLVHRAIHRFVDALARQAAGAIDVAAVGLRTAARTRTIGVVLRSTTTVVIYGLAGLDVLGELGLDLGPLIAGAGIAGVAIGFGAQSLVKDFLTGVFMLIEDQYGVGDVVDLGVATGTVEAVTLRSTRLRSADGTVWHVSNGEIVRVGNKSQQWSRALLDVAVAYDSDLRGAEAVIKAAADSMAADEAWADELLDAPEVWGVERIANGGADIRLIVKTRPASQFRVMRELRVRVKEALDDAGIRPPGTVTTEPPV